VAQYTSQMDPIAIADESFDYVRTCVYNYTSTDLGDAYYNQHLPIVKLRLIAGGVRLAQALNTIMVGDDTPKVYYQSDMRQVIARQIDADRVGSRMKARLERMRSVRVA